MVTGAALRHINQVYASFTYLSKTSNYLSWGSTGCTSIDCIRVMHIHKYAIEILILLINHEYFNAHQ